MIRFINSSEDVFGKVNLVVFDSPICC